MQQNSEKTFLKAVEICQSLPTIKREYSTLPCDAIHLLCEVGKEPINLISLCQKYSEQVEIALKAIESYARSIDNWRSGDCPLGGKDHCNILHFLLNAHTKKFQFFRAKNLTPELICELLKEWKEIDMSLLLQEKIAILS